MASLYKHEMVVEFAETDMAGIVHFSQFFRYAERAEHAFLRSLGMSVTGGHRSPGQGVSEGWPRVHASFDFLKPLRFEDPFTVTLGVGRVGNRSVHYLFRIDGPAGLCGKGKISAAHVRFDPETKTAEGCPVPDAFREKVTPLGEEEQASFFG